MALLRPLDYTAGTSLRLAGVRGARRLRVPALTAPRSITLLWSCTLFLAAALTFSIQPLYGRLLLPHLGGAPATWVVALLFFQTALLAGYGYAHLLSRVPSLGLQVVVHVAALALSAAWLPPALRVAPEVAEPGLSTVLALASGVGPPYIVLVATAPLLQHWFARGRASGDPYALYAASNGGSLAGLLAYPFLLEPLLGLTAQSQGWAVAYAASALLIAGCGLFANRLASRRPSSANVTPVARAAREPITLRRSARWIALAAVPTAWLGASSTYVTTAVAPVPLLWVLPLAAYLLTLIIAFAPVAFWGSSRLSAWRESDAVIAFIHQQPRLVARLAVAAAALAVATQALEPSPLIVFVHVGALFAGALACHSTLAADRPGVSAATAFYLALAAGGAVGGAFAAVAAPLLFETLLEYPLVLAAFMATGLVRPQVRGSVLKAAIPASLAAILAGIVVFGTPHWFLTLHLLGGAVLLTLGAARSPLFASGSLLLVLLVADATPVAGGYQQEWVERSFFGVNRVLTTPDGSRRVLMNGLISHGTQLVEPSLASVPQGYFTREGPLGDVLREREAGVDRIGVVGLGAGTIACYADASRRVTFYEIDQTVIDIARNPSLFTYLTRCKTEDVVVGDARLSLQREANGAFDVLIIDAYSGDTMPLHLLTREAFALYRRVLAPTGVIALHVSNKFFDLEPLVAALAADAGLSARIREDGTGEDAETSVPRATGWLPSVWTLVGSETDVESRLAGAGGWRPVRTRTGLRVWTDDYANPLAIRR